MIFSPTKDCIQCSSFKKVSISHLGYAEAVRTRLTEAALLEQKLPAGGAGEGGDGKRHTATSFPSVLSREILQEIQRLRLEHEQASQPTPEKAQQNPTLLAELRLLR